MQNIDEVKLREIQARAFELRSRYTARDAMYDEYERMYLMKWNGTASRSSPGIADETTRLTVSPTARDKILGMCRLLYSQSPVINLESSKIQDRDKVQRLESSLTRFWNQAGRVNHRPLEYDITLSNCLYGQMDTAVIPLKDYAEANKNDQRVKRISKITPVMFQSWNPRHGFADFDELGLCAYYRSLDVDRSMIEQKYASILKRNQTNMPEGRGGHYNKVGLNIFYDLEYYAVWLDNQPILCEKHGYPCIPVDVTISSGSSLFEMEEDRRQPVLYSLSRSGLWENESLLYTVLYTQLFTMGIMPTYVHRSATGKQLTFRDLNGTRVLELGSGDSFDVVNNKGIFGAEVQGLSSMTKELIERTTIFGTAFGERNNVSGTFSETSLLEQSARLPLIEAQRLGGQGIASAIEMALMVMKARGINFDGNGITLKGSELPDDLEVRVELSVQLPHEQLQKINTAVQLLNSQLASVEYVRDKILGIANGDEIERQIVQEAASRQLVQQKLQSLMQQIQASEQQQQAQEQQQLQQAQAQAQAALEQAQQQQAQQPGPQGEPLPGGDRVMMDELMRYYQAAQGAQREAPVPSGGAMPTPAGAGMDGIPSQMGGMIPGMGAAGMEGL